MDNANLAPRIEKWELFFKREHGSENRDKVVRQFVDFYKDDHMLIVGIDGQALLGGRVYGRAGFQDGEEVFTSYIQEIEKIERGEREKEGEIHDLYCARTKSGSEYYFYSDDMSPYMTLMMGDLTHLGRLEQRPGYYLNHRFRGGKFL